MSVSRRIVFTGDERVFEGNASTGRVEIASAGVEERGDIPLIVDRHDRGTGLIVGGVQ